MDINAPRPGMRYGVGFGQSMWLNEHFLTLAHAEAFFAKELEQVKASFVRSFRSGKFTVEDVPVVVTDAGGDYPLMRRAKVQNIKKNGQPGKFVFSLHLYEIRGKAAR